MTELAALDPHPERVLAVVSHPDDVECGGTIEFGLPLRRDLAQAIRRHRPDTVLLFNHRETEAPGGSTLPITATAGRRRSRPVVPGRGSCPQRRAVLVPTSGAPREPGAPEGSDP